MEVIYKGTSPLSYHSAPSGNMYMFDPGVPQKIDKADEKFFAGMCKAPNSKWEQVTITEKLKGGTK